MPNLSKSTFITTKYIFIDIQRQKKRAYLCSEQHKISTTYQQFQGCRRKLLNNGMIKCNARVRVHHIHQLAQWTATHYCLQTYRDRNQYWSTGIFIVHNKIYQKKYHKTDVNQYKKKQQPRQ